MAARLCIAGGFDRYKVDSGELDCDVRVENNNLDSSGL